MSLFYLKDLEYIHLMKTILTLTPDARKRPTNRRRCSWPIPMKKVVVDPTRMRAVIMKNRVAAAPALVRARDQALVQGLNKIYNKKTYSSIKNKLLFSLTSIK